MSLSPFIELGHQVELQAAQLIPIILGGILTLVQCFFGFKLLRYLIAFWGFALFGFVGYSIGGIFGQGTPEVVGCIILGAIGAFIAYKFYMAGVFIQGFAAGLIIGLIIGNFSKWAPILIFSSSAVLGILLGLLAVYLLRPMVILTSGFTGGMSSGTALAGIFGFAPPVGAFLGIILSILGIVYQFTSGKEKDKKSAASDKKHKGEPALPADTPAADKDSKTHTDTEDAAVEKTSEISAPDTAAPITESGAGDEKNIEG